LTAIGTLTEANIGAEVSVQGEVVAAASFSKGFTFTLDDGTGQIELLMWHNVYDDCWDALGINLGAEVQATGEVGLYEGTLQIEPNFGGDVKAVTGATAVAPVRDIGSLSGSDEGSRVMIEGQVLRVEGLSSAVKVSLGDETGEVVIFIWRNVLDRIADNTGLGTEGSRVRVVGVVGIYRSNLQVAPTLPNDVTVLEIAGNEE
jgi:DNA/RNA endonuclease YhcR with UshA esterase domain